MCFYAAWEAFDCFPSWMEKPDPRKPFHGRHDLIRNKPLWNEYKDKWSEGFPLNLRDRVLKEGRVDETELQDFLQ
jgi:hypothetical protein